MRLSSTLLHWQCIHASRLMSTVNNAKIGNNCNVSFAYIITNFHELLNFSNYHIWWYLYIYLTLFWLESDSLLKLLASIPDTFKKSNACHGASKNMSKSKNAILIWCDGSCWSKSKHERRCDCCAHWKILFLGIPRFVNWRMHSSVFYALLWCH